MKIAIMLFTGLLALSPLYGQTKPKTKKPECNSEKGSGTIIPSFGTWDNFEIYKCENGKIVVDKEATEKYAQSVIKAEQHRKDLLFAARSRVLTTDEMKEIEEQGIWILMRGGGGYTFDQLNLERQLDEILLQQFRLRVAADQKCQPDGRPVFTTAPFVTITGENPVKHE